MPIRARVLGHSKSSHVALDAIESVEALVVAIEIEPRHVPVPSLEADDPWLQTPLDLSVREAHRTYPVAAS